MLGKLYFALSIYFVVLPKTIHETKRIDRQRYASNAQNLGQMALDPIDLIRAEISKLNFREKQLQSWLQSANSHELRRHGLEKSQEAEDIARRLRQLRSLL